MWDSELCFILKFKMSTVAELRVDALQLGSIIEKYLSRRKFNLDRVKDVLLSREGWTYGQFLSRSRQYLNFMLLNALVSENEVLTPPPAIARFWDCHVEDLEDYQGFCIGVLGKFVPRSQPLSQGVRVVSLEETSRFYFEVFREHFEIPEKTRKRAKIRYAMRQNAFY